MTSGNRAILSLVPSDLPALCQSVDLPEVVHQMTIPQFVDRLTFLQFADQAYRVHCVDRVTT